MTPDEVDSFTGQENLQFGGHFSPQALSLGSCIWWPSQGPKGKVVNLFNILISYSVPGHVLGSEGQGGTMNVSSGKGTLFHAPVVRSQRCWLWLAQGQDEWVSASGSHSWGPEEDWRRNPALETKPVQSQAKISQVRDAGPITAATAGI